MSGPAIRVEGLSKRYRIGAPAERYRTLRDAVSSLLTRPFARRSPEAPTIWALRDVSFEVARGEVVGVIGRNGAGKSTLLKILSRITEPTGGRAEILGRVGALLEVGTGFHMELTGRENVFLNGAILGMPRAEIRRKFDAIVSFAEVERFIDTPVKHYSSGMHLRLAFSVAAHLEPEILLVDEVLAVGDAAFQRKCMGKMEDVAQEGRTVLFVSHNLSAVRELCHTALVLRDGRADYRGPVASALAHYTRSLAAADSAPPRGTSWRSVRIAGAREGEIASIAPGEGFAVEGRLDLDAPFEKGRLFCILLDASGQQILHERAELTDLSREGLPAGRHRVRVAFPPLWLAPNVYALHLKFLGRRASGGEERHDSERLPLDVSGGAPEGYRAALAPPARWEIPAAAEEEAHADALR